MQISSVKFGVQFKKRKKKYVLTHSISVFKSLCNILKLKVISVFSCSLIACTAKKLLSDLHKNYDTFFSGSLSCNPTLDLSLDWGALTAGFAPPVQTNKRNCTPVAPRAHTNTGRSAPSPRAWSVTDITLSLEGLSIHPVFSAPLHLGWIGMMGECMKCVRHGTHFPAYWHTCTQAFARPSPPAVYLWDNALSTHPLKVKTSGNTSYCLNTHTHFETFEQTKTAMRDIYFIMLELNDTIAERFRKRIIYKLVFHQNSPLFAIQKEP